MALASIQGAEWPVPGPSLGKGKMIEDAAEVRRGESIQVPGYRVVRKLGSGGFATVYEAVQEDLEAPVALKVLTVDPTDERLRARFERECRAMGRLRDQRGVVPIYRSAFASDGRPVIVMAYMPGGSLRDRLEAHGPFSAEEVVRLGVKVLTALDKAHAMGIFHRDIKPENILFGPDGEPALADMGIASVDGFMTGTRTEASLTPPHAPPEQFMGRSDSTPEALVAGDVYSAASTLYQLLTGRPPFGTVADGGIAALIHRVVQDPPPPIERVDVPPQLNVALAQGLAKNPADRPRSAAALSEQLTQALTTQIADDVGRLAATTSTALGSSQDVPPVTVTRDEATIRRDSEGAPPPVPASSPPTHRDEWPIPLTTIVILLIMGAIAVVAIITSLRR